MRSIADRAAGEIGERRLLVGSGAKPGLDLGSPHVPRGADEAVENSTLVELGLVAAFDVRRSPSER